MAHAHPKGPAEASPVPSGGNGNGNGHQPPGEHSLAFLDRLPSSPPREGSEPAVVLRKKVAIVGFAPSSFSQAPFANPEWTLEKGCEIWGLNELYKMPGCSRADRWFDIHDRRDGDISLRDPDAVKWLRESKVPVYMQEHYDDIPMSVRFPLREAIRFARTDYFTNTISYMVVLALMEGRDEDGRVVDADRAFGEIHVYGVDMAQDSEYAHQRPSCEYVLGLARGMGVKVHVPKESDLLKIPYLYGYEADGQALRAKLDSRIKDLVAHARGERDVAQRIFTDAAAMQAVVNEIGGILAAFEQMTIDEVKAKMKSRAEDLAAKIPQAQQEGQSHLMTAAMLDGAHDDAVYWRRSWTGS